jgi:hypothetical protein
MTEENISAIGIIIIYILTGAFVGSMVTCCLMADSYVEDLCIKLYSNTQDYKACLNRPWKEILEEINK